MTPVELVLSKLEGVRPTSNGWEARCLCHEDRVASLCIAEGGDGRALLDCKAGCKTENVVSNMGLKMSDLFPRTKGNGNDLRSIIARYPYTDENDDLLFEVVRYQPKDFRQRRPDGNGGWIWKVVGTRQVLYRLTRVLEAVRKGQTVFIVEGEKDVHLLEDLRTVATTNPGGASKSKDKPKWRKSYSNVLRGAHVIIIADNDEAGRAHAQAVATSLYGVAKNLKVVELPDLPPGGDVSDFLKNHSPDELAAILKDAPEFEPPSPSEALIDEHDHRPDAATEEPSERDPISLTSDIANIRRFVAQHGQICRWLSERRRFKRYLRTHGRWALQDPFDLWQETVKSIYAEASAEPDEGRRKQLGTWARQCESTKRYRDLLVGLQQLPEFSISVDAFDRDPFLVNARNCTLDLSSRRLESREHRADDFCFLQLGCDYDPHAVPVAFLTALNQSLPEPEIRHAFQVIMGQALIAKPIQRLPFITGPGGQGKTTFAEAIAGVFGSYAKTIDAATLAESHRNGAAPSPDIARLAGARLVMANDPRKEQHLAQGLTKNLTGGDTLAARFPYGRDLFEFVFHGTVVVRTNHLPRFDGGDYAMARRVLVIPFDVIIPPKQRDEDLPDKLAAERSGILNWLLEGAITYLDARLQLPKAVELATRAYIRAHDPLGRFADERLEFDPDAKVANDELQSAWQHWFENEEGKLERAPRSVPRTIRTLKTELKRRFPKLHDYRNKSERGLEGLSLVDGDD